MPHTLQWLDTHYWAPNRIYHPNKLCTSELTQWNWHNLASAILCNIHMYLISDTYDAHLFKYPNLEIITNLFTIKYTIPTKH